MDYFHKCNFGYCSVVKQGNFYFAICGIITIFVGAFFIAYLTLIIFPKFLQCAVREDSAFLLL